MELDVIDDPQPPWNDEDISGFTVLDGELFIARTRDLVTTVVVFGVDSLDRRQKKMSLRPVRHFQVSESLQKIDWLWSGNGLLYAIELGQTSFDIAIVNPYTGSSVFLARIEENLLAQSNFDTGGLLFVFTDMSAYERRRRGARLSEKTLDRVYDRFHLSSEVEMQLLAVLLGVFYQTTVKDDDGCVIDLDSCRRLRLYGPDLRLVRDFGRLVPSTSSDNTMFFDRQHGILYMIHSDDVVVYSLYDDRYVDR